MRAIAQRRSRRQAAKLFISYSHRDEEIRTQLETHLSLLKREGAISIWHDRKIESGVLWDDAIAEHLCSADIILFLVSAHFAESDYCWENEMTVAMRQHESGKSTVIPIIVRPLDNWQSTPFAKLQALPEDGKPVTTFSNPDQAFANIARGIREALANRNQNHTVVNSVEWQLTLDAEHSVENANQVVRLLRQHLSASLIFLRKSELGSMRLTLESAEDIYHKAVESHRDGSLSKALGHGIVAVSKALGAIIRVRATSEPLAQTPSLTEPLGENEFFEPLLTRMVINPKNPIQPGFQLSCHSSKTYDQQETQELTRQLGGYLNTFLIVTTDNLHANLSPHEEGCGLPKPLRKTELGLKLLRQDLELKIQTSLLLHPKTPTGKAFWEALPRDREIDAVTRVWITPAKATVEQKIENGMVCVTIKRMNLKVLAEQDFQNPADRTDSDDLVVNQFRDTILPELEKRVHFSSTFSDIRQLFSVLIMANWMRRELAQIVGIFGNTNDPRHYETPGLDHEIETVKRQYLDQVQNGSWTYQLPAETTTPSTQRVIVVGGIVLDAPVVNNSISV